MNIKQVQTAASCLRSYKGSSDIHNEAVLSIDHHAGQAEPVQGLVALPLQSSSSPSYFAEKSAD